jgi:hypothetical protein
MSSRIISYVQITYSLKINGGNVTHPYLSGNISHQSEFELPVSYLVSEAYWLLEIQI